MLGSLKDVIRRTFRPSTPAARDPEARKRSVEALETLFFDLCRELAPDLFIEAGAKDAYASRRIPEGLPNARVVAFEANPFTFKRFKKKIDYRAQGVEYIHRALSDSEGTVTFNVRIVDGRMSSDGQGSMLVATRSKVGTTPVEVASSRIDCFFPPESFGRCAIWIDVEGASREVLRGASGILDKGRRDVRRGRGSRDMEGAVAGEPGAGLPAGAGYHRSRSRFPVVSSEQRPVRQAIGSRQPTDQIPRGKPAAACNALIADD
jgi:FkbM family methyltransferase